MPHSSQKQRVSIIVDAHLLAENWQANRCSAAFEEALRLWRPENWGERQFYQNRQADIQEEEEAQFAQEQMEETGGRRS